MNSEPSGEATAADKGALGLIGALLAVATVMVTITATIAVSAYRGDALAAAPSQASPVSVVR